MRVDAICLFRRRAFFITKLFPELQDIINIVTNDTCRKVFMNQHGDNLIYVCVGQSPVLLH
jgi:hypothetical protein